MCADSSGLANGFPEIDRCGWAVVELSPWGWPTWGRVWRPWLVSEQLSAVHEGHTNQLAGSHTVQFSDSRTNQPADFLTDSLTDPCADQLSRQRHQRYRLHQWLSYIDALVAMRGGQHDGSPRR